jgi:predicted MPP superfamily phosphohydrolase
MEKSPHNKTLKSFHLTDKLWDLWCIFSIIGIWPRFIEPNLLVTTRLTLPIPNLPLELKGLKIVQFSDLHINPRLSDSYLKKLQKKIEKASPDIVVFTGDFLCYSLLNCNVRLKKFLNEIQAPYGCYAIFGNHDYEKCVSVNEEGNYDLIDMDSSLISKGFQRLFCPIPLTGNITEPIARLNEHQDLRFLLSETPFQLLNNSNKLIKIRGSALNISGVGEHMMGRCKPEEALRDFDKNYPGIILAHNPDCIPALKNLSGNVILCGHTHGAQVNLPWIWKNFIIMENMEYKRGLFKVENKWVYVNRGVGSVMPFRWFSIPEILVLTLE